MQRIYAGRLKIPSIAGASGTSGGIAYGSPTAVTLASNILTVTGPGWYTVTSESGTTDQLDKITGLSQGDIVMLQPTSTHTITVAKGTYLKMQTNFVLDNVYDKITFICEGSDVCSEHPRSSNA